MLRPRTPRLSLLVALLLASGSSLLNALWNQGMFLRGMFLRGMFLEWEVE